MGELHERTDVILTSAAGSSVHVPCLCPPCSARAQDKPAIVITISADYARSVSMIILAAGVVAALLLYVYMCFLYPTSAGTVSALISTALITIFSKYLDHLNDKKKGEEDAE